jgi:hypothetical protein
MPVETILVICDSAKERNREAPRPSPFSRPGAPILVFPEHTVIFFVHADTIFYSLYSAMEICEVGIKVLDETQTITPLQQNPWLRVYQCNFYNSFAVGWNGCATCAQTKGKPNYTHSKTTCKVQNRIEFIWSTLKGGQWVSRCHMEGFMNTSWYI